MIEFFSNEMIFAKINAEKADSNVAKDYSVKGFPTFVLTDADGVEVDRIIGYLPADEFLQTVDDYKNGIGTLADLLSKAETSQDRSMFMEIANKYKYRGMPDDAGTWFEKVIGMGNPTDSLSGEARFSVADMKRRNDDYDGSIADFRTIKADFKDKPLSELASIYIPYVTAKKGDTANAIMEYEKFIKEFPESEDVEFATEQINELKGIKTEEN